MSSLLVWLESAGFTLAAFVAVIMPVVFFHELGHLLVGLWRGVKPEKFSIGFGPKIFGFRVGETEVRLSLLPLGGYVKFAGDNPLEEPKPEDRGRGFIQATPLSRGLIAAAGPFANFALAFVIFFALLLGPQRELAPAIGFVKPGSPAAAAGLQPRDQITSVDGAPVQSFTDLQEIIQANPDRQLTLGVVRAGQALSIQVTPEAVEDRSILETVKKGRLGFGAQQRLPVVAPTLAQGAAMRAGLQPFDRIAQVDGAQVASYEELLAHLASALSRPPGDGLHANVLLEGTRPREVAAPGGVLWVQDPLRLELPAPALGRPATPSEVETLLGLGSADLNLFAVLPGSAAEEAGLQRGDRLLSVDGKPVLWWSDEVETERLARGLLPMKMEVLRGGQTLAVTVVQHAKKRLDEAGVRVEVPELGASPDYRIAYGEPQWITLHYGVLGALRHAGKEMLTSTRMIALGLSGIASGKISTEALGGPLMIADVARKAAESGLVVLLGYIAMFSVNLGLMNLLPLPVLDGFHVLSAILERIRRRPLSLRVIELANMFGLAALVTLMLFAFKNDLVRKFFQN